MEAVGVMTTTGRNLRKLLASSTSAQATLPRRGRRFPLTSPVPSAQTRFACRTTLGSTTLVASPSRIRMKITQ